jgi:hypothetical protein
VPASRRIGIVHLLRNKSNVFWAKRTQWMAGQRSPSLISKHVFWRSVHRCMEFAYYVLGNRTSTTRAKADPRYLMDQTPEDLRVSTKRKIRAPSRTSSSRPVRLALDVSETAGAAPREEIAGLMTSWMRVPWLTQLYPPIRSRIFGVPFRDCGRRY